jgi:DNA repair photolyase
MLIITDTRNPANLTTIKEKLAKNVLTKTGIEGYNYCINPYVGCAHGCRYCYASFMKRFTGHMEPWGEFVDVKMNAPEVLRRQLRRARKGSILIGTVTDPYQAVEKHYRVTRGCLEALLEYQFPVNILTRSPLVVRDIDLFRQFEDIAVGLSVTTNWEEIRKTFEPNSPSIQSRIKALGMLRDKGITTYAFIGPMLPLDPEKLLEMLTSIVDEVLIDRLNYSNKVKSIYLKAGYAAYLEDAYFIQTASILKESFEKKGIPVSVIF